MRMAAGARGCVSGASLLGSLEPATCAHRTDCPTASDPALSVGMGPVVGGDVGGVSLSVVRCGVV